MGSVCVKHDDFIDDPSKVDLIDLIHINEKDYENTIFGFCREYELKTNILKNIQMVDFINMLNNFEFKTQYKKISKFTYDNEFEDNDYTIFVQNKILENPLMPKIDDYSKNNFKKFLNFIYENIKEFHGVYEKYDLYGLSVPKYLISTIGFNFCNYRLSQKVNVLINILCNEKGFISKSNHKVIKFLACYIRNAIILPMKFLLFEIEYLNDEVNTWVTRDNYIHLTENFEKTDDALLYKRSKDAVPLNITESAQVFFSEVLVGIFSGNKKELTKDEFKSFLLDQGETGGFWLLFNEGIRKKFEVYIKKGNE